MMHGEEEEKKEKKRPMNLQLLYHDSSCFKYDYIWPGWKEANTNDRNKIKNKINNNNNKQQQHQQQHKNKHFLKYRYLFVTKLPWQRILLQWVYMDETWLCT